MKRKKILTVIGARPQIIKAAAISRSIRTTFSDRLEEVIVHTGQHYDNNMSQVFFDEMNIPAPHHQLAIGSAPHGEQTARMLEGLEKVIILEKPDAVLVYGDTNSTLSAALAAAKLHIPVIHVEAGLRSFDKSMPEEINRIATDHVSTLLFSPTTAGINNLIKEGFVQNNIAPFSLNNPRMEHCGDVMYDNAIHFRAIAEAKSTILQKLDLGQKNFFLATIHRDSNTDDPTKLSDILNTLIDIQKECQRQIIVPLHPRTANMLKTAAFETLIQRIAASEVRCIDPVSYLDMIALESRAELILTDSGGVQKEAYFFEKPCIILRAQTEWVELVEGGNATIADASSDRIREAVNYYLAKPSLRWPALFGDGHAAEFICESIIKYI